MRNLAFIAAALLAACGTKGPLTYPPGPPKPPVLNTIFGNPSPPPPPKPADKAPADDSNKPGNAAPASAPPAAASSGENSKPSGEQK